MARLALSLMVVGTCAALSYRETSAKLREIYGEHVSAQPVATRCARVSDAPVFQWWEQPICVLEEELLERVVREVHRGAHEEANTPFEDEFDIVQTELDAADLRALGPGAGYDVALRCLATKATGLLDPRIVSAQALANLQSAMEQVPRSVFCHSLRLLMEFRLSSQRSAAKLEGRPVASVVKDGSDNGMDGGHAQVDFSLHVPLLLGGLELMANDPVMRALERSSIAWQALLDFTRSWSTASPPLGTAAASEWIAPFEMWFDLWLEFDTPVLPKSALRALYGPGELVPGNRSEEIFVRVRELASAGEPYDASALLDVPPASPSTFIGSSASLGRLLRHEHLETFAAKLRTGLNEVRRSLALILVRTLAPLLRTLPEGAADPLCTLIVHKLTQPEMKWLRLYQIGFWLTRPTQYVRLVLSLVENKAEDDSGGTGDESERLVTIDSWWDEEVQKSLAALGWAWHGTEEEWANGVAIVKAIIAEGANSRPTVSLAVDLGAEGFGPKLGLEIFVRAKKNQTESVVSRHERFLDNAELITRMIRKTVDLGLADRYKADAMTAAIATGYETKAPVPIARGGGLGLDSPEDNIELDGNVSVSVAKGHFKVVLAPGVKPEFKVYPSLAFSHGQPPFMSEEEATCEEGQSRNELRNEVKDAIFYDAVLDLNLSKQEMDELFGDA